MEAIRSEFVISKKDDDNLRKISSRFSFKEKTKVTNFQTDPPSSAKQRKLEEEKIPIGDVVPDNSFS